MEVAVIQWLVRFALAVFLLSQGFKLPPSVAAGPIIQDPKSLEIQVQILFKNKPVEGATVWLVGMSDDLCNPKVQNRVEPIQTSKSGSVRLPLPPGSEAFQIYARHGSDLSGLGSFRVKSNAKSGENGPPRIDLNLAKTQSIQGRLFLKDKPIAGARCKICTVARPLKVEGNALEGSMAIHPRTGIRGFSVSATTDQEGRFSLDGYPADCKVTLQVEKANLGSATIDLSAGKPTEWELEQPGNLAISVEGETAPVPLRNLTLDEMVSGNELRRQGRNIVQLALGNSIHRKGLAAPTTGEAHKGTYQLNVPVDPTLPYHFGPSQVVKIEPGKTTSVVLRKMPLAYCSGRIIDAKTGKGIANLSVQLDGTKEWNEKRRDASKFTETIHAKTDRDGRYSIPCKGDHTYVLNFDCSEYDCDHFRDWDGDRARIPILPHQFVAAGEKASFPDLSLIPARSITGTIKDDEGKPVGGSIVVHSFTKRSTGEVPYQLDKGKLTLTQLASDLPLPVFIRKGNAVNVPTVFPVKTLENSFVFTISEKNQVRTMGKIVDERGKPIPKARALMLWLAPFPSKPVSVGDSEGGWLVPEQSAFTDKQGAFSTGGLWPGAKYHLQVSAEGYRKWLSIDGFKTPGRKAEPGKTIDFGTIVLTKAPREE